MNNLTASVVKRSVMMIKTHILSDSRSMPSDPSLHVDGISQVTSDVKLCSAISLFVDDKEHIKIM